MISVDLRAGYRKDGGGCEQRRTRTVPKAAVIVTVPASPEAEARPAPLTVAMASSDGPCHVAG
jgi:hypothetical protein